MIWAHYSGHNSGLEATIDILISKSMEATYKNLLQILTMYVGGTIYQKMMNIRWTLPLNTQRDMEEWVKFECCQGVMEEMEREKEKILGIF